MYFCLTLPPRKCLSFKMNSISKLMCSEIQADSSVNVPLQHWVYPYLERLEAKGVLRGARGGCRRGLFGGDWRTRAAWVAPLARPQSPPMLRRPVRGTRRLDVSPSHGANPSFDLQSHFDAVRGGRSRRFADKSRLSLHCSAKDESCPDVFHDHPDAVRFSIQE